ncbi:MAG TPA: ATP-binding cassette domain-containing protein [Bryobacteraceae bacterium]
MRKLFAPEVVQTSSLDCGPAALKSLLEGFGIPIAYGRLREACQTGLDGTLIDTVETVANELGLEAEQIMLPVDHLLLPEAKALPAIVVVTLPNGMTHFVVVWRRHGSLLQVMDPGVGRRWLPTRQFVSEIYRHTMAVPAADWREFAASDDFQIPLRARLAKLGISKAAIAELTGEALSHNSWRELASLDAATRLLASLDAARGLPAPRHRVRLLRKFAARPELIPPECWSAAASDDADQVLLRGAVLVRAKGKRKGVRQTPLPAALAAAVEAPAVNPARALFHALRDSGRAAAGLLLIALIVAAGGTLVEALLFRGLLDINTQLHLAGQRAGALGALWLFSLALLLFEIPMFATGLRLGRQIENRLRILFLEKIPKLGDRYFQSRLTSDMAERSHSLHKLRQLPDQVLQLLSLLAQMTATAAGIVWLEPAAAPFILTACAAAVLPIFAAQSLLAERDLRTRNHAAGLTRFYLDAMLGLVAIRAHGAERNVRHEQEKLLGDWAQAAWRLQRAIVSVEALQLIATFACIAALFLLRPLAGAEAGRVLLAAYWALTLPMLGQDIGMLARQLPAHRNLTLRLLEPLGAPEEFVGQVGDLRRVGNPPIIEFHGVSAEASGHPILTEIDLTIETGTQLAIVGPSGAGKSSLVGILLGWLTPRQGTVRIDGEPLDCERLRLATAWVDPGVQLWNRSLFDNLRYGAPPEAPPIPETISTAMLHGVLESLPQGLQTKLGEGGALVSGGEGQRVRLGRALARRDAKLVILDEPFRGLDREKRRELLARAREFWRGATLLCITHDLEETRSFDRVAVVEAGRIAEQGAPADLAAQGNSRYAQLLAAEQRTRSGLWSGALWRRIRIHSGQIVEELPRSTQDNSRASEVA